MNLLLELMGYKKLTDMTMQAFIDDLEEKGDLKELGHGRYAKVLEPKGKDYVYKVWAKDFGYEAFVELAMKNQDNPSFPKFLSKIKKIPIPFKRGPESFGAVTHLSVIRMEKLKSQLGKSRDLLELVEDWYGNLAKYGSPEAYVKAMLARINQTNANREGHKTRLTIQHSKKKMTRADYHQEYLYLSKRIREDVLNAKLLTKQELSFVTALSIIREKLEANEMLYNDLHINNMLWRGNAPVITDPFTGAGSVTLDSTLDPFSYYDHSEIKSGRSKGTTSE